MRANALTRLRGRAGSSERSLFTQCTNILLTGSLYTDDSLTRTFVNSEDPDEMPHNVKFHQGLHCL